MPNSQSSSEKVFTVNRSSAGINSIGVYSDGGADNVITLTENHSFLEGETVRVISDTGQLPDGLMQILSTMFILVQLVLVHHLMQIILNLRKHSRIHYLEQIFSQLMRKVVF